MNYNDKAQQINFNIISQIINFLQGLASEFNKEARISLKL